MVECVYGLRIARVDGPFSGAAVPDGHDVVWHHQIVDRLDAGTGAVNENRSFVRDDGLWIEQCFGDTEVTKICFHISPDGAVVQSWALNDLTDGNRDSLFYDVILRTVLTVRKTPSFHAAALRKDGSALLIMGDKGFGKSTLSAALQQTGWSLLSDDLVRVERQDDVWLAHHGKSGTRLNRDSCEALDYSTATLPQRWDKPATDEDNKWIVDGSRQPSGVAPIAVTSILLLQRRSPSSTQAVMKKCSTGEAMSGLINNATPGPFTLRAVPEPYIMEAVGGLIHQAQTIAITLPDALPLLKQCAAQIGGEVMDAQFAVSL